jgi:hypothetical protein
MNAVFRVSGELVQPRPGSVDLPQGNLIITYPLASKGEKSLEFTRDAIIVKVRHPGAFTEFVPLLVRGFDGTTTGFTVTFDPPATSSRTETTMEIGRRRLAVLTLKAKDWLTYRLEFAQ